MTVSATVEKFSSPEGALINTISVQLMAHLDIGLAHLKHREDVCTHLYLDL